MLYVVLTMPTLNKLIYLFIYLFPKLLLLLVPKVTTRSLYPECIANLKIPIDAFYRKSRSNPNNLVVILRFRWKLRRLSADRGR